MSLSRRPLLLLLCVLFLASVPWLGMADFYTRGEPREAVVAQTMLEQGNWILPTNNGGEMAYKPPFFHWCVAAVSAMAGGVSTWSARLPSALAAIFTAVWVFLFVARRRETAVALTAALVCAASFEIYRAAYACRVDMVLTFCIVGAMLAFGEWAVPYNNKERGSLGHVVLAALMMSLGCLTKGPVAIVLPCGLAGLAVLLGRRRVASGWAVVVGAALLALVLPALWYWAAYQQGGDTFLALVKEENIDRFLGKMSYASHENGLWYYFVMFPAGLLPWTLLLFTLKGRVKEVWARVQHLSPWERYMLLAAAVVFVFYCIPKSKRGVYIMPVYPFVAYFVAAFLHRFFRVKTVRVLLAVALGLYTVAFAVVVPLTQNRKSDLCLVREIDERVGHSPLTSYVAGGAAGDPPHFFTLNFYLHNRVGAWGPQTPSAGYILLGEADSAPFFEAHPDYLFTPVPLAEHKSCDIKQVVRLYRYQKR